MEADLAAKEARAARTAASNAACKAACATFFGGQPAPGAAMMY